MAGHDSPLEHASADWVIADPGDAGAISVQYSGVCNLVSASGNETRTLADPTYVGQWMVLHYDTDGGTQITVTAATSYNKSTNTTLLFAAVSEVVYLVACTVAGALVWRAFSAFPEGDTATAG